MAELETFLLAASGGINQSAPDPGEKDLEELENFAIFRKRIGLRPPFSLIATIQDDVAADVDEIIDIVDHEGILWVLSWSLAETDVYLHSMQVDGSMLTLEAVVYTGIGASPVLTMTSFTGGTAEAGVSRLYIADYNQTLNTVFWNGSSITTLTEDLDNASTAEDLKFSLMTSFKFHLWGTGFFEAAIERPEMLRFTQPGAIPATDEAGGVNPKEWFSADHRSVGRRGDKIVALSLAGDRMLVFQKRATHVIYGSGQLTWTTQSLSNVIGCVGPYAATSIDERVCYFWASDGPYRTDGNSVQYIGDPIQQIVTEVDADELKTHVGYSPDDGLVYYIVSLGGADDYSLALVFDAREERWLKAFWLIGASTRVQFGAVEFLDSATAPGPEAAPGTLAATATSATTIDLTWVNGDVNVNTKNHIYRDTSGGFTPDDTINRIAILGSGSTTFTDTSRAPVTQYFYKMTHFRNTTHSSESNQDDDTTWLSPPTAIGLAGLTDGLRVTGTNNAGGAADIEVERKIAAGMFAAITGSPISTPGGTFSIDDTGLSCGTEYFYRTRAVEAGETDSEWSATVSREGCDATTIPADPTGFTATTNGENQIDLAWTDASDNEDSFEVFRSTDGGTEYSLLVSLNPEVEVYSNTGLTSNTQFHYKVRASNAVGPSAFTAPDNDTTDANLTAPTDLALTVLSSSVIKLDWSDDADDDQAWEVFQASPTEATYGKIATLSADSVTYNATGLSADTVYFYKVRATGFGQNGADSNRPSATTDEAAVPIAPTLPTAVENGETIIDVGWQDNSSDETGFKIFRGVVSQELSLITTTAADVETFEDTGLSAGTEYFYEIKATNAIGDSAPTTEVSATTDGTSTVPADPSNLTANGDDADLLGVETTAVDLTWDDNSDNEVDFVVERCEGASCSSWAVIATLPANTTSYRDTGVTDDNEDVTTFRYRVKATNAIGPSGYTSIVDGLVEPQTAASTVVATDDTICFNANPFPPPDEWTVLSVIGITWEQGDITGLEGRSLQASVDGGAFSTIFADFSNPDTFLSHSQFVEFGVPHRYRVLDEHGTTGENTGTFTSAISNSQETADIECP